MAAFESELDDKIANEEQRMQSELDAKRAQQNKLEDERKDAMKKGLRYIILFLTD